MAISLEERRLREFVNRINEMRRFCEILDGDDKPIMVVWGESGIGKSSLLSRMQHECAQRKLVKAEIVCKETRTNDHVAIMRKIRDDVGVEHFREFTDLVNFFTDPTYQPKIEVNVNLQGTLSVAEKAGIRDSSVGDIAGVVIKDNMFVTPRPDLTIPEPERVLRLTERFLQGLKKAAEQTPLVIFIDEVEKLSPSTEKWLWEELLDILRNNTLPGVRFVLCGQKEPELDRDWRLFVESAQLRPLALEHIATYLVNRGVKDEGNQLAMLLLASTNGKIAKIAEMVDAFLLLKEDMGSRDG